MLFQMYIKDDRNQWNIYGAGNESYMTELFKEYVETCQLYGHDEKDFKVVKSYQQEKEADRPKAYCPHCQDCVTYQVRQGFKYKIVQLTPKKEVDYRVFTCHCEVCQTVVEVPHYEILNHQNYMNVRKEG